MSRWKLPVERLFQRCGRPWKLGRRSAGLVLAVFGFSSRVPGLGDRSCSYPAKKNPEHSRERTGPFLTTPQLSSFPVTHEKQPCLSCADLQSQYFTALNPCDGSKVAAILPCLPQLACDPHASRAARAASSSSSSRGSSGSGSSSSSSSSSSSASGHGGGGGCAAADDDDDADDTAAAKQRVLQSPWC